MRIRMKINKFGSTLVAVLDHFAESFRCFLLEFEHFNDFLFAELFVFDARLLLHFGYYTVLLILIVCYYGGIVN